MAGSYSKSRSPVAGSFFSAILQNPPALAVWLRFFHLIVLYLLAYLETVCGYVRVYLAVCPGVFIRVMLGRLRACWMCFNPVTELKFLSEPQSLRRWFVACVGRVFVLARLTVVAM